MERQVVALLVVKDVRACPACTGGSVQLGAYSILWSAGLFEWSMRYQDGTRPTAPQAMSSEDRVWLEDALKNYMVDLSQRMKEIKDTLNGSQTRPTTLEEKEMLLEELMELVEGIDQARGAST